MKGLAFSRGWRHSSRWLPGLFLWQGIFFSPLLLAAGGVSLEATRVIYDADGKSASIVASNASRYTNLVQSWVENNHSERVSDFFTIPPLFQLESNQKNAIQIIRKTDDLPEDRESLYWLNVNFVPPSNKEEINVIRFSLNNRIKLIYRPDSLRNVDFEEQTDKLEFRSEDGTLLVENKTPYYINTSLITANGNRLENPGYFAPFSIHRIAHKDSLTDGSTVKIYYINDFGGVAEKEFKVK